MSQVYLLDKKLSKWVSPINLTKNQVNKNEVHLLDKRLRFGLAGLLKDLSSE